jgi:hypothetical protein
MLTVEYEEQEGITVPYPALFDDIRTNHGFADLRGRPELAGQVSESLQLRALQDVLVELAHKDAPFFTIGCDLGAHEEQDRHPSERHVAGGYLQIMDTSYWDRLPNDYLSLAIAIAHELEKRTDEWHWIVRFVHTPVQFNLDDFENVTPHCGFGSMQQHLRPTLLRSLVKF